MGERLEWFPCYPSKLLDAIAGLPNSDQRLVYQIVLLRIYDARGPIADSVDAIAGRCGLNRRRTAEALDALFRAGKLVRIEGGIHNPKAVRVLHRSETLHQGRQEAGAAGGRASAEKRKENQGSRPSNATARLKHTTDTETDSPLPNGSGVRRARKIRSVLPENWGPSAIDRAFARKNGFADHRVEQMAERFRNHHRSRGTLIADVAATWRTWVLNQVEFDARDRARSSNGLTSARGGFAALVVNDLFNGDR